MSVEGMHKQLLVDRVVAVFEPIDERVAERTIGQLLYLEELDAEKEMTLSLSAAGGSIAAGLQILQTIGQLGPPLRTVCLERCGGMATLLLAAGARGKRLARQGAKISLDNLAGDLHVAHLRSKLVALFAALTCQPPSRIAQDMDLELELTADGARKYGLVDEVVVPPKKSDT
jgi:ATP-dependent Clp protease protease subunit